jgi:hypothetical protein
VIQRIKFAPISKVNWFLVNGLVFGGGLKLTASGFRLYSRAVKRELNFLKSKNNERGTKLE